MVEALSKIGSVSSSFQAISHQISPLRRGSDNRGHDELLRVLRFCVQLQSDCQAQVGQPHRGQHQGCGGKQFKAKAWKDAIKASLSFG